MSRYSTWWRGRVTPSHVELRGLNLTLHVSADGQVLTTLPKVQGKQTGSLPAIELSDGQITIRQDGRPEFALHGLSSRIEPNGAKVVLSGSVADPAWGRWTVSGECQPRLQDGLGQAPDR